MHSHERTYYHHHHPSACVIRLPLRSQTDRQTDSYPPLTAIKVSVLSHSLMGSYSSCHCHSCLLSCSLLNFSVLRFSSQWSAVGTFLCCLRLQLALTSPGFIYLSVDVPVCVCVCVWASVCYRYGLPSLVKWFVFLLSLLCAPVKWFC